MIGEEELNQRALVKWALLLNSTRIYPFLFHIPNGGKRSISEANRFKLMGVKPGVCDLFLAIPNSKYHGLFIEMKSKKGKLCIYQNEFIENMKKSGYDVLVCNNWEIAKDYILEYLND